jgi:hypothetical protein
VTFDPGLTQRIVRKAKSRIVPNWKARMGDYSSRIAQWGALVQGGLLLVPAAHLPVHLSSYVALIMFILVGGAKIITEPGRKQ